MKILLASSIDLWAIRELEKFHQVTCGFGASTHDSQREIGEIIYDVVASYTPLGKVGSL